MSDQGTFRRLVGALCLAAALALTVHGGPADAGEHQGPFGMTMVDIPAGKFMMGACKMTPAMEEENRRQQFLNQPLLHQDCTPDEEADDDETPRRQVTVWAFQMAKHPVTLGQFKEYIAASGRSHLITENFMKHNNQGDSAPVVMVSWHDAQDFVRWLNQNHGHDAQGIMERLNQLVGRSSQNHDVGWHLPSEAQWEYACRAGGNHRYCGSDNANEAGWHRDNSGGQLQAVGQKLANAFGLHDMSGNVWEWVQDCYQNSYALALGDGRANNGRTDRESNSCDRAYRGGSWYDMSRNIRAASRGKYTPYYRNYNLGFRLARTLP